MPPPAPSCACACRGVVKLPNPTPPRPLGVKPGKALFFLPPSAAAPVADGVVACELEPLRLKKKLWKAPPRARVVAGRCGRSKQASRLASLRTLHWFTSTCATAGSSWIVMAVGRAFGGGRRGGLAALKCAPPMRAPDTVCGCTWMMLLLLLLDDCAAALVLPGLGLASAEQGLSMPPPCSAAEQGPEKSMKGSSSMSGAGREGRTMLAGGPWRADAAAPALLPLLP